MSSKFQKQKGSIKHPKICKKSPPVDRTKPPLSGAGVTFPQPFKLTLAVDVDSDINPPGSSLSTTFAISDFSGTPPVEHNETVVVTLLADGPNPFFYTAATEEIPFFGLLVVTVLVQSNGFFLNYSVAKEGTPFAEVKYQDNQPTPSNWDTGAPPFPLTQGVDTFNVTVNQLKNA